jgi:hypothetical protein
LNKHYKDSTLLFSGVVAIAIISNLVHIPAADAQDDYSATDNTVSRLSANQKVLIPQIIETAVPEPEPTYTEDSYLTSQELKDILYQVGFRGEALRLAWATAMKESTGRPMAHNQNSKTGDNSYGLFQINMIGSMGPDRREKYDLESNEDLFDPIRNAEIAFEMSNAGENWGPWNGINDATKQWLDKYPG